MTAMRQPPPQARMLLLIALVAGGPLALAAAAVAVALYLDHPGGMAPSYRAVDHDPRLSVIASEATPMVAAVDAFYRRHLACPRPGHPDELGEFRAALAGGITAERHGRFVELTALGQPLGWLYEVSEAAPQSCTLRRKLGWDPSLLWERRPDGARWLFVPGDGSPDREVVLDPQ